MAAADGLIDAAEAIHNPAVLSLALYVQDQLYAQDAAFRDADPVALLDALRRGLVIAQDSGNRYIGSLLAVSLCRLEAVYGDPLAALDYITLAIRTFHDAGDTAAVRGSSRSSPPCSTGSDATNQRPPWPGSPSSPTSKCLLSSPP